MRYLKIFLVFFFVMAVYVACVIWITYGVKIDAGDKFLICVLGISAMSVAHIICLANDLYDN